jgi:uncharacterized membrane protein YdjX (TVP38/TMEM64 family)
MTGEAVVMRKYLIAAILVAGFAAFFLLDLDRLFTLEAMQARAGELRAYQAEDPLLVIATFFAIYVAATALSVPGAAILTLVGGALFGVVLGTIIVSFASTIGATLAFLSSRTILGEWVQARFGDRLQPINDGVERDGAFYLFSLRLVPLFPFFLVNLLMGLTRIRTVTFMWVSQLGMLLGTIVYVNAGTQLAQIDSLSGIASPALLGSFIALAALPWVGKWVLRQLRRQRGEDGDAADV